MKKKRQKHVNINESFSLREQLTELYMKYRRSFFNVIHNEQLRYLKDYVISQTAFLPTSTEIIIRLYCVLQNITELPKCRTCGRPIELKLNKYKRFNYYCNASCRQRDKSVYAKQSEKKLRTYGSVNNVEQMLQTKEDKYGIRGYNNPDKANKTKFELHGSAMYDHEKYKATSNELYGVDNYMQSEEGKAYYKSEIEKKYGPGITNTWQLEWTHEKGRHTKKDKYGDENYNNPEQTRATCMKLYGVEYIMQCPEFQNHRSVYHYDNCYFDSKPELAYYIWLRDSRVKFEFHNKMYFDYEFNGKRHRYFPDFYLVDEHLFVEIKGDHFFNADGMMICPYRKKCWTDDEYARRCKLEEAKHKCMLSNGVKILRKTEYIKYVRYVEKKYGNDYIDRFRKTK